MYSMTARPVRSRIRIYWTDLWQQRKPKETYNKVIPLYKMTPGVKYSGSLFIWSFTPSVQMTCSLCKPSEWGLPRVCRSGYDRVSSNLHSSSDATVCYRTNYALVCVFCSFFLTSFRNKYMNNLSFALL